MSGSVFSIPARAQTGAQNARKLLRDFIGSQENVLVDLAATALTANTRRFETLTLYGPTGTGKSMLANNLVERWQFQPANGRALIWCGADFARAVADAIDTNCLAEFRHKLSQSPFVIVDGLEELVRKSAAQHELSLFLDQLSPDPLTRNQVAEFACRVVLISRRLPTELSGLEPRLVSRIMAGLCVPVSTPGPIARRIVLTRLADLHGVRLAEPAIDALADGVPGLLAAHCTVLEMNHVLIRLAQLPPGPHHEIGLDRLHACSGNSNTDAEVLKRICAEIARTFGIRISDLVGPSRRQGIVRARGVALFLCRQLTTWSLQAIGEQFGGRDHTTVLHACRKIEQLVSDDATLRGVVEKLSAQLAGWKS